MGHQFATNMENPGRWGRWVLREISSMVDNGYFLEPHKGDLKHKCIIYHGNLANCNKPTTHSQLRVNLKDGAYYCHCAYVLRILKYSDFLSVMLTNTGIFLRSLNLSGKSRS